MHFFFLLKGRKGREIICRHEGEREVKLLISLSSNSVYLIIIVQVIFFFLDHWHLNSNNE